MSNDLEERSLLFARSVRLFIKSLPSNIQNQQDGKQLIRSSGSIGANYIEANETVGSKDFLYRLRISRKESKETLFWLSLIDTAGDEQAELCRQALLQETRELRAILSSIIQKASQSSPMKPNS